jgi:3-oxoadipate enol-lactonase
MHQGVFQTSDDCPIAYTLRAARNPGLPRVVLIHSVGMDASIWDGVVPRLAVHADILTYDCRGHGRSGKPAEGFTIPRFARDLLELLDHVGWESAVAAGCSMGGCVAQAMAGLYHSRVSALGLIDTTAWYGEDAAAAWRDRADTVLSKGLVGLVEFQLQRWFGDEFRKAHPELVRAATEVFLKNDLDCYAASCIMLGETDLRDYLKKISVPATIIVGEDDYATTVTEAKYLYDAISNSTLTVIPRARHLTPIECPEEVTIQLIGLLGRI